MKFITLTVNPCVDISYYPERAFVSGALNRVPTGVETPGGKGINVSRSLIALGELGLSNTALYFAAHPDRDENSAIFSRLCSGIDFGSFSPILYSDTEKKMRRCIKVHSPDGKVTEINEAGASLDESDVITLIGALTDLTASGEPCVLLLCGSIPQDVELPVYNLVINLMKSCGVTCVLDSSGAALANGIEARPDLIKPNLEELSELAGRPLEYGAEAVEYCKYLFHRYGCEVLLTNGGKGSYFVGREGVFESRVKGSSHSLSTGAVGCGDIFLAAFVQSYFSKKAGALASLDVASSYATFTATHKEQKGVSIPDFDGDPAEYENLTQTRKWEE